MAVTHASDWDRDGALKEVRKFLEDPVGWSKAHGGIGSLAEAKPKDAAE